MNRVFTAASLVLSSFLFTACQGARIDSTSESDFKLKQECQKYVKAIEDRNKKHDEEMSWNRENGSFTYNSFVQEMFYSKKRNSCLYVSLEMNHMYDKKTKEGQIVETYQLTDALSNEVLEYDSTIQGKEKYQEVVNRFNDAVKTYK